jgi:hypothetical protein
MSGGAPGVRIVEQLVLDAFFVGATHSERDSARHIL